MRWTPFAVLVTTASQLPTTTAYWMEDIPHQGLSSFNSDPNYTVFRNVHDYGAKGDGQTDDTAAINRAISSGGRCGPWTCLGNTVTPAVVYFPAGTYKVSNSIVDYFYTQIIGDPTDLPVIKAAANFSKEAVTAGLLDGNPYINETLAWKAVNMFFRQVRNLVLDTTEIPASAPAVALHWPSSQATSVNNIVFRMPAGADTSHTGLVIEAGSGGYIGDLIFEGGRVGAEFNNQQYTARNLSFSGVQTAVKQGWNWSWTYKSLSVKNCSVGVQMAAASTGSLSIVDSEFVDVAEAIVATYGSTKENPQAGSLFVENSVFSGTPKIIVNRGETVVAGGDAKTKLKGYLNGNSYTPSGPRQVIGQDPTYEDPPSKLLDPATGKYYERSKPHYETYSASQFISARSYGVKGDGKTDDTLALNNLLADVASRGDCIVFVDAGTYLVTDTVFIPAGAKIVGEALASVILGYGEKFQDIENPYPVVQVGKPGDRGRIEWSDMVVSTRGPCPGAKLIEYNLYSPSTPSGIWDVHVRVGGFAGSDLLLGECPTTLGSDEINKKCIAAHTSLHITKSASGLYHENCWIWVSDHDLEDQNYTQITIYAGRGILIESTDGRIWISGSGSEHHVLYQYQLADTRDVYMGLIQSETPYFQPNPPASKPFPVIQNMSDPDFASDCKYRSDAAPCEMAWALRVLRSKDVVVLGAGLYSFFNNYSTECSAEGAGARCQARIFDIQEGNRGAKVSVWNLNTIGSKAMVTRDGVDIAGYNDNMNSFTQTINKVKS